jgi:hypothetical protein
MNSTLRRDLALALTGCLLALGLPVGLYVKLVWKPALTEAERFVVDYTPASFSISRSTWQEVRLTPPLTPGAATPVASLAPQPAAPAALPPPPPAPPPTLSFILQDGGSSTAIVNGSMVKAGSEVQGWTVERIERNRVLLRNRKGPLWLTLD